MADRTNGVEERVVAAVSEVEKVAYENQVAHGVVGADRPAHRRCDYRTDPNRVQCCDVCPVVDEVRRDRVVAAMSGNEDDLVVTFPPCSGDRDRSVVGLDRLRHLIGERCKVAESAAGDQTNHRETLSTCRADHA